MKSNKKILSKPLDQSRIFYQTFLNSSDAIIICDPAANTLFTNPAYTKLYGYSEGELMGRKSGLIRHKDTPKKIYQEMWAAITDPETGVWQGEIRNRKKDGSPVEVELTVKAIFDENREIIAFMSVAVDISEKKQIENKLIEQEKLYSIGLLSSGIAHEIGSPLNVISGRAEMIKEGLKDGREFDKSLEIIIKQTERISDLVKSLLNFSRSDSKEVQNSRENIDLKEVLHECSKLLQKTIKDQGIKFDVIVQAETVLKWNFHKSEQVFINLLQNAIHAVEKTEKPIIEVIFRSGNQKEIETLDLLSISALAIEVRDNGVGIPEGNLNRIFDPFYTTKSVGMGTGLGLSVVYGLVKEADGFVRAESKLGQGTKFTLVFPAKTLAE